MKSLKVYFKKFKQYGLISLPICLGIFNFFFFSLDKSSWLMTYSQYSRFIGIFSLLLAIYFLPLKGEDYITDDEIDKRVKELRQIESGSRNR